MDKATFKALSRMAQAGKGVVDVDVISTALRTIGFTVEPTVTAVKLAEKLRDNAAVTGVLAAYDLHPSYSGAARSKCMPESAARQLAARITVEVPVVLKAPTQPVVGGLYRKSPVDVQACGWQRVDWVVEVNPMWIGVYGQLITAPNGSTFAIPAVSGNITCAAFWSWLYKSTDATTRAKDALAALPKHVAFRLAHVGKERTIDNTGTCGICGQNVKRDRDGTITFHGYQRPGYGYTMGDCFGHRHQPIELSSEVLSAYIGYLRGVERQQVERLANWRNGTHTVRVAVNHYSADGFIAELRGDGNVTATTDKPSQRVIHAFTARAFGGTISGVPELVGRVTKQFEAELKSVRADIAEFEKKLATWEPSPLPDAE